MNSRKGGSEKESIVLLGPVYGFYNGEERVPKKGVFASFTDNAASRVRSESGQN